MAKISVKVNWFEKETKSQIEKAKKEIVKKLALQVEARAKANITENDQIDTGFMLNSVYAVLPDGDSYTEAMIKAKARARRDMAPRASLDGADAAVACGAEYAIEQELHKAFLLPAVDQASDDFPDIVTKVSRSEKM